MASESSNSFEPVGVIGLGAIGGGVAKAMVKAGVPVIGCDITDTARQGLTDAGGDVVSNSADLAGRANVIFLFLVNAAQARAALFGDNGLAAQLPAGSVIVSCITMAPNDAISIAQDLTAMDINMVDAPTSGGAGNAEAGRTKFMVSGNPDAVAAAMPSLDAVSDTVYHIGDEVGQGSTVKVVHQLLTGVHITAAMEAVALGAKLGIEPKTLFDVVTGCAGNSWMFENRVPHVLDGDYTPLSAVEIFVKDLGLVLDTGKEARFPLPIAAAAHQQFLAAAAAGYGREDDAAVIKVYRDLTGIDLPESKD